MQLEQSVVIYCLGALKLLFNPFCLNLSQCLKWKQGFKGR